MNRAILASKMFVGKGNIESVEEHPGGNVNDTFVVGAKNGKKFILQRLNTKVFKNPELVIANMCMLNRHADELMKHIVLPDHRRWEIPRVLHTLASDQSESKNYWIDEESGFWRAISFIEGATAHQKLIDPKHGFEVGFGLGIFQSLISKLRVEDLHDTLPGFHVTPHYLARFFDVLKDHQTDIISADEIQCVQFIKERAKWCSVLEDAAAKMILKIRPIHGDPKTGNIMLDNQSGKAVALIDLDTVKPGLVHYDIGDCLRSSCNLGGEEPQNRSQVTFQVSMAKEILKGYLSIASSFFSDDDYEYLYDATRLISFELGLRFFTDYLENNVYFKVKHPKHNLERALVQFKLTESIEAQETDLRKAILEAKRHANRPNEFDGIKAHLI
jgi:thiamine kinase-like enzyme